MDCDMLPVACQLDRIASALTGFDWNTFVSTLLATLVGAGVAAWVSFWLTNRERPQPMWKVEAELQRMPIRGIFTAKVIVTNIGDGAAYHPRITVSGTGITGSRKGVEPVLEPGEQVSAWCGVPGTGQEHTDPETLEVVDDRAIRWPSDAAVLVQWHQPPRRNRTMKHRLTIDEPSF